jgi:hypothetical protein
VRSWASQTPIHSALLEGANHLSGSLDLAWHHHTDNARQHRNFTQRPFYGDPSSVMRSLLQPCLHTSNSCHDQKLGEVCLNLAFAEDFAVKRGAPLRVDIRPSELNRLQPYIAAIYLSIHYRYIGLSVERVCVESGILWPPQPALSFFYSLSGSLSALNFRSIPTRTLSVSAMLPMSFFRGGGSSFMRVGAATIWPSLAKMGC